MQCWLAAATLPLLLNPVPSDTFQSKAPKTVAGRTVAEWSKDLDSPNEFIRLRAMKSMRPFGKSAVAAAVKGLSDKHAGVQYLAASHLGDVGSGPKGVLQKLETLEAGKHPATAMAAAYALCRLDNPDVHIKLLISRLEYPERGMACCAAEFLGKIGPDAKSAVSALEAAYKRHDKKNANGRPASGTDYHVRGACQNALRLILGEWEPN